MKNKDKKEIKMTKIIKIIKVSLEVLMGSSMLFANQMKLYDVKSGKITYEIKGSGKISGQKMQSMGKKRMIFDAYGAQHITEENRIDKQTVMREVMITKTHSMTYLKGSMAYYVSFENRQIRRTGNMAAARGALMSGGKDIMKKRGGKKTGTDKVLGYTCDMWDLMGTKQCIYKGIPLRVETNMRGIKNTVIATKAEFDIALSDDDFKLPDFPIYDTEGNKLDKSKLDAMDKKSDVQAEKDAKKMVAMKASMAEAMQSSGVKEGEIPTETQMEDAVWKIIKKQMLAQAKGVEFVKECYSDADTTEEANICTHKMDEMNGKSSDPEGDFVEWSAKIKKETLGYINQSSKKMECIKKANSMHDIDVCLRQE